MSEPAYKITQFLGTDNTSDPSQLQIRGAGAFFRELLNVDIDDEGMLHRRQGYDETPVVSGSDIHSLWSDGKIALFVQGTELKKLNKDLTTTLLITGLNPRERMTYLSVNGIVFFANNSIIGHIINGLPYPFPDPQQPFKIRMIGGHILEFYNGRLYAANGRNIFFSDATILTRMDRRKNAIAYPDRITMMKAVRDGLYVSAGDQTFFLKGDDPFEFVSARVLDEAAIEGSAISVDGDDIGRGASGKTVYFLTHSGPHKGYPGGTVVERQDGRFAIVDDVKRAPSILREDNGYRQYVSIYQLRAGLGGADGEFVAPVSESEGG